MTNRWLTDEAHIRLAGTGLRSAHQSVASLQAQLGRRVDARVAGAQVAHTQNDRVGEARKDVAKCQALPGGQGTEPAEGQGHAILQSEKHARQARLANSKGTLTRSATQVDERKGERKRERQRDGEQE